MSYAGWFLGTIGIICLLVAIGNKEYRKYLVTFGILIGFIGVLLTCIVSVPVGSIGIILRFSNVTGSYLPAGLHVKSPIDKIIVMNIQTQKVETTATAASMDLQDTTTNIALNYELDPIQAVNVYKTIGTDYINVIAQPSIQEIVKEITAKHNAEEMITNRAVVKDEISTALTAKLKESGITVEAINITDFKFSDQFTAAIEAKVVAQQAILTEQNKLEQVKVQAQEAQAAATGDANATIARANGQAEANSIIAQSLTPEILQYIFLDKLGSNVSVVVVPQGQNFTLPDLSASTSTSSK
jgi:regulator of protease activity HflC (stomatin/prohibitin superfamily)